MPLVRVGPRRGGAPGERSLTPVADGSSFDAVVRGALEAAWVVARVGEQAVPPIPSPRSLRPLLRHARLTAAAFATIRKALDDDADFRARVAEVIDEETVGRGGWLFLVRPEGWEDELAGLVEASASDAAAQEEGRAERSAARRLKGTEEALRRAEEALASERSTVARLAVDVGRERAARRAAEDELARLRERVAALEAELAALRAAPAPAPAPVPAPAALDTVAKREVVEVEVAVVPPEVVDLVAQASEASRVVQERLADAVAALVRATVAAPPEPSADVDIEGPPARERRPAPARRRPASLPPAVFEDSVEAADHLVRRPGAVLLVDGYNSAMGYRPDLPIAELRRRLVDAVDELVIRTGVDAQIVFDGAEMAEPGPLTRTGGRRRAAKVAFSPPEVEADDVILDLVDAVPLSRPVVVASDDRRVQDGARRRGANVIGTDQLLAVLRRER